ncbi:MAG: hypothetical protein AB1742_07840 [bacterium]
MAIINPPRELREKLGDAGTDALVALINRANDKVKEDVIVLVEEKFERRLAEEIAKVRVEIAGLRVEIAETKSELIRWMFIFWAGQIVVLTGLLFAFFK